MIAIGLLLFVLAGGAGAVGVFANEGSAHGFTENFAFAGYHLRLTSGQVFLGGLLVGAILMLGLILLIVGVARAIARRPIRPLRPLGARRAAREAGSSPEPALAPEPTSQVVDPLGESSVVTRGGAKKSPRSDSAAKSQKADSIPGARIGLATDKTSPGDL
jgi:hypothetical protein